MKGLHGTTKTVAGRASMVFAQHATETVGKTVSRTLGSESKGYTQALQTINTSRG